MTPAEIAAKLTGAQRETIRVGRWISVGGQEPFLVVSPTHEPWPEGVAELFTLATDRLTPLGLAVRRHLEETDDRS